MTSKQLLALIAVTTVTFLSMVIGGGYVYLTNPSLLGLGGRASSDSVLQPPAVWEVELDRLQRELHEARRNHAQLNDSLAKISAELARVRAQYQESQQLLTRAQTAIAQLEQMGKQDSLRLKNLRVLAEMYDRADPAEVAKILANAESSYAAAVLRLMKRKTAARVLEQLPKEKALAISLATLDQH
jgi:flagellar motility protein MotE (MotC chaperone)